VSRMVDGLKVTKMLILLSNLSYYYAIATFDSAQTASIAYSELDGTELERSANLFDLSYVPEDMQFDDAPRDEATHDEGLAGLDFTTDVSYLCLLSQLRSQVIYSEQSLLIKNIGSATFQGETYMGRR